MNRLYHRNLYLLLFLMALFLVRWSASGLPAVSAEATGALIGLITNAKTGERLSNVSVSANGQTAASNQHGVYVMTGLPAGEHLVSAEKPGFDAASKVGLVIANTTRWNSIALTPLVNSTPDATPPPSPPPPATPSSQTGTLIGLVTDAESGERLARVTVSVAGQAMVTDGRGVYRFENVSVGWQNVRAEKRGYQAGQKSREVIPNEVRWNSIKLTKHFSGCPTESVATFELIPIVRLAAEERPDYLHGDLNLAQRGYGPVAAEQSLQDYAGDADPNAPQLAGLFEPNTFPGISSVYRVNHWDWGCGEYGCRGAPINDWPVTLLGLPTRPGQPIYIPERAAEIYGGGYKAMVLYAEEKRITLGYIRNDSVAFGYAVHLENVCVDPNLLSLYRAQINAFGFRARRQLPALRNNQPLGVAYDQELRVAIRDRGAFIDPRSRKDWWRGY